MGRDVYIVLNARMEQTFIRLKRQTGVTTDAALVERAIACLDLMVKHTGEDDIVTLIKGNVRVRQEYIESCTAITMHLPK